MIRAALISLAAMLAAPALALTPLPPCDKAEAGMYVHSAGGFGHGDSGFVIEGYANLNSADGVVAGADGPIPALNDFNGARITECRTGQMVAVHGVMWSELDQTLPATEFLRAKVQGERAFSLRDVQRAAKAVYGKESYVRILRLKETEETCACAAFYPQLWAK